MAYEARNTSGGQDTRRADQKLGKLFESPYLIRSPEAPADFSDIGNGHEAIINHSIDEVIGKLPAEPSAKTDDPFETPFLDE